MCVVERKKLEVTDRQIASVIPFLATTPSDPPPPHHTPSLRTFVVGSISVLNAKVKGLEVQLKKRKDQLLLDQVPDDPLGQGVAEIHTHAHTHTHTRTHTHTHTRAHTLSSRPRVPPLQSRLEGRERERGTTNTSTGDCCRQAKTPFS